MVESNRRWLIPGTSRIHIQERGICGQSSVLIYTKMPGRCACSNALNGPQLRVGQDLGHTLGSGPQGNRNIDISSQRVRLTCLCGDALHNVRW